ncbi:hypothetical protein POTOM_040081 [Populus tomentosa]|uniref:Terpene synthase n=1 Tax=Populus tomentosa TaxID=118781 RepID=A0A8X7YTS8_POPTO|nr:hypothetical protein POTOM_040081 [Populus tomentosa]
MSSHVSAAPNSIRDTIPDVTRRSANFHPSIWGDYFVCHTFNSMFDDHFEQEFYRLKEEVKEMLYATTSKLSQQLNFIDVIQRLGVSCLFESDIDQMLCDLYHQGCGDDYVHDHDLQMVALRFRLLRQQGHYVSCDMCPPLLVKLRHALDQPIHKDLPWLGAKRYISSYEQEASHSEVLLKFAKLNFNFLQNMHQKELADITMWDISNIDHLPEYMKYFYNQLLDVYKEIETGLAEQGRSYRVDYAKEAMKKQVQAYFVEARWLHENYMPTMDEYMRISLISSGYPLLTCISFVGMGDIVTKDAFEWLNKDPKIVKAASVIARLMDDIVSHKFEQERGHVASAIECYMNQHEVAEEQASDELRRQVVEAWKDINEELLIIPKDHVPIPLLTRVLNLARVMDVMYKDGDGYTNANGKVRNYITSLLIEPVQLATSSLLV